RAAGDRATRGRGKGVLQGPGSARETCRRAPRYARLPGRVSLQPARPELDDRPTARGVAIPSPVSANLAYTPRGPAGPTPRQVERTRRAILVRQATGPLDPAF